MLQPVAVCSAEEKVVAYRGTATFHVERSRGESVLAIGGYFKAPERFFRYRRCVITVNGTLLDSSRLLSPRTFYQPRHPGRPEYPRIDNETGGIRFPFTHASEGLRQFSWDDVPEYDKWVPLYNDFPQTVYFDISGAVTAGAKTVNVRIFNNLDGTAVVEEKRCQPPFVVTRLTFVEARPAIDSFGPYVVPIWSFLDARSWARKMAAGKLRAASTPSHIKGQILFQTGMLNMVNGHENAALRLFRRAASMSRDFPEYEEACYRLLRMTGEPVATELPEDATSSGRWARLYNRYRAVVNGDDVPGVIGVPYDMAELVTDGRVAEEAWSDPSVTWHPLPRQMSGPPVPDGGRQSNQFAMVYDNTALKVLFRGPGMSALQPRDIPGEDRPAWEFNCVELFVCPEAAFTRYYELNVTAANGRYDSRLLWNGVPDPAADFAGEWTSGTSMSDKGMIVEYSVPWSDFGLVGPPRAGDLWIGNVIRVEYLPDAQGNLVHREYSAGDILGRNFHRLQDTLFLKFEQPGRHTQ